MCLYFLIFLSNKLSIMVILCKNRPSSSFRISRSKKGIAPTIWGKYAWKFFEAVLANFPTTPTEIDKQHYLQFFKSLQHILPCGACRNHFKTHTHTHGYHLNKSVFNTRCSALKWLFKLHNLVNSKTGKRQYPLSPFLNHINNMRKNTQNTK